MDKYIITSVGKWKTLPHDLSAVFIFYQFTTGKTLFVGEVHDLRGFLQYQWEKFGDNFKQYNVQLIAYPKVIIRKGVAIDLQKLAQGEDN